MDAIQEKKTLTQELKKVYADTIGILFNGVLRATPDQINDQVVTDVDKMLVEVARCSEAVSNLGFDALYELILSTPVGKAVDNIIENFFLHYKVTTKIEAVLKSWVLTLASKYQYRPCLDGARVNWKSKIELDLLDI